MIFSYIRRLGHFLGSKFLIMGFQKNEYKNIRFCGYFLGHHKIGLYLGAISICSLGYFLKVKVQNGGYFWGLLKFQKCFGVLDILDIFGLND